MFFHLWLFFCFVILVLMLLVFYGIHKCFCVCTATASCWLSSRSFFPCSIFFFFMCVCMCALASLFSFFFSPPPLLTLLLLHSLLWPTHRLHQFLAQQSKCIAELEELKENACKACWPACRCFYCPCWSLNSLPNRGASTRKTKQKEEEKKK